MTMNTVKELLDVLGSFKAKLAECDKDAVRDIKSDYELIPQSQLDLVLRSQASVDKKRSLLLSQIGLLRINLFSEYNERVRILEEKKDLDQAITVMNDYAENVAIPFISSKKKPSFINRFMDLVSKERPLEPFEYVRKWREQHQSWFEYKETSASSYVSDNQRQEMFAQLKIIFNMLYAVSFSDDNFPPSPSVILFDSRHIRM